MNPIFPQPGHIYQLKPLGLGIIEPIIAKVRHIGVGGVVVYDFLPVSDIDLHEECHLSDFVLMIDKEVEAPTEGGE